MASMKSFRCDPHRLERKLLQASATGRLPRVIHLLEKSGTRYVRKKRKFARKSEDSSEHSSYEYNHKTRNDDTPDQPSTSEHSYDFHQSLHGSDGNKRRKQHRWSLSSRSRKNDGLRAALGLIDLNCMDSEGLTPLHHACYAGSLELVEFYLSEGADPSVKDLKGNTPLHIAARLGFTQIISVLRNAGGSMEAPNYEGVTPLVSVQARIERLRQKKEETFKTKKYVEPVDWSTRLEEELSDGEGSWWGNSWCDPERKNHDWGGDWSGSFWKDEEPEFWEVDRKRKPKDPLEGGLFKELNNKRKREIEEKNREARRILEDEIAKDKAWREKVLLRKSVDRNKLYEDAWRKFLGSCNLCLSYSDVPFPVEKGKDAELSKVIFQNAPPSEHKKILRKEVLRWHPGMYLFLASCLQSLISATKPLVCVRSPAALGCLLGSACVLTVCQNVSGVHTLPGTDDTFSFLHMMNLVTPW